MLNKYRYEAGIGLVEVLVAVLLLAVAVLGFSAMQMRAIKATDETLLRSDAIVILRNISENLRLDPSKAQKDAYQNYITGKPTSPPLPDCSIDICNARQQQKYNLYQTLKFAQDVGIDIGVQYCPHSTSTNKELQKLCLIASWGETQAVMSDSDNACATAIGVYNSGQSCFIVETY